MLQYLHGRIDDSHAWYWQVEQQAIEPVLALATATSVADQSDGSRLADDLAESRAQNVSIKIENRHLQVRT